MMKFAIFCLTLAITAFSAVPACATWSVVKLDEKSKSIVVAGASCSYMVYGIAGVVQCATFICRVANTADVYRQKYPGLAGC